MEGSEIDEKEREKASLETSTAVVLTTAELLPFPNTLLCCGWFCFRRGHRKSIVVDFAADLITSKVVAVSVNQMLGEPLLLSRFPILSKLR
ncbi:hypothetical protein PIB30_028156 [Stylosanthes scabra]|uniref:Uncharacterized protein n=1 Tax=Stylosanthes scabra TaxID=79078 RepID=A0ABU6XCK8_9FABA|nr:hypothetical protein [Stylosanthes scabra]